MCNIVTTSVRLYCMFDWHLQGSMCSLDHLHLWTVLCRKEGDHRELYVLCETRSFSSDTRHSLKRWKSDSKSHASMTLRLRLRVCQSVKSCDDVHAILTNNWTCLLESKWLPPSISSSHSNRDRCTPEHKSLFCHHFHKDWRDRVIHLVIIDQSIDCSIDRWVYVPWCITELSQIA